MRRFFCNSLNIAKNTNEVRLKFISIIEELLAVYYFFNKRRGTARFIGEASDGRKRDSLAC